MKKKYILTQILVIAILIYSCNSNSQISKNQVINAVKIDTLQVLDKAMASIKDFHVVDWEKGDIDNDQQDDFVVVMLSDSIYNEPLNNSQLVKIALLKSINFSEFTIMAINDKLVDCSNCANAGGAAPLQGLSIDKGFITILISYGLIPRSTWTNVFKFDKGAVYLYSVNQEDYNINTDETKYYDETTRKDFGWIKFEDYAL